MAIAVTTFGSFKDKRVDQFRLVSDTGVTVDLISYGVAVRDWRVPVAGGERGVVLGDRPGVQVYNGVWTDIPVPGLNGKHYGKNSGFCLEDQSFADAVHNPHFPNIIHSPERPYRHWCEFEIA